MKFKNLFWGVFFLAAAAVIVFSQLGYFTEVNLISLVITILLIPVIIKSAYHLNFGGILFPLAIMGIMYAGPLGIASLVPWPILAVALFGTIGLSIIFGGPRNYKFVNMGHYKDHHEEGFEEIVDVPDDNMVDFRVNFGASVKYVNSNNLQKANLSCSFGALKVYLDRATVHPDGAQINLDVSFGAIELFIPRNWKIRSNVDISLGGIDEKNGRYETEEGPTVVLTGRVSLAGVEITYV